VVVRPGSLREQPVVRLRPDGSRGRRLLPGSPRNENSPAFAPDGSMVFDGATQELFVMRRNGTGSRQITATNGVVESRPDWQRR
jgi:hypothetical protein